MRQDLSQFLYLLERTKELQPGVKTVSPNGKLFDVEYAHVRRPLLREAFLRRSRRSEKRETATVG
jgi:hypothetical protein